MHGCSVSSGWIGVDLDGTLVMYEGWKGVEHIGEPIPLMMSRVKTWVKEGRDVRIFTARVSSPNSGENMAARAAIQDWLQKHGLPRLPVVCSKDYAMIELWDDRCIQVIPNTGQRADGK
jgi:hypothetical protein